MRIDPVLGYSETLHPHDLVACLRPVSSLRSCSRVPQCIAFTHVSDYPKTSVKMLFMIDTSILSKIVKTILLKSGATQVLKYDVKLLSKTKHTMLLICDQEDHISATIPLLYTQVHTCLIPWYHLFTPSTLCPRPTPNTPHALSSRNPLLHLVCAPSPIQPHQTPVQSLCRTPSAGKNELGVGPTYSQITTPTGSGIARPYWT